MNEYRLIKKEVVNGLGEKKYEYIIQKKFLWWWFLAGITCRYHTYEGRALLITRRYTFMYEKTARSILEKLVSPLLFTYKGNVIKRVFNDDTFEDVYINLSNRTIWEKRSENTPCYEYSYNLDELKASIDRRIIKSSIQVIQ